MISKKCSRNDCKNPNKLDNGELLLKEFGVDKRSLNKLMSACKYCYTQDWLKRKNKVNSDLRDRRVKDELWKIKINKQKLDLINNNPIQKKKERNRSQKWSEEHRDLKNQMNKNYYRKLKGLNDIEIYSSKEIELANLLKINNIQFIQEKLFRDCRSLKNECLPFDFFLSDLNICIEYDGIHHFKPIFGEKTFIRTKSNDKVKDIYCLTKGIKLIRISYLENIEDKIKKNLENLKIFRTFAVEIGNLFKL